MHLGPLSPCPLEGITLVDKVAFLLAQLEHGNVLGEHESVLDPHDLRVDGGADGVHGVGAGDGGASTLLVGGGRAARGAGGLHAATVNTAGFALGGGK